MYKVFFSKYAVADIEKLKVAKLSNKAKAIIDIIKINPFQNPPPYEKLVGNLKGLYSRKINIKHRIVYDVDVINNEITILRMWTHYEI